MGAAPAVQSAGEVYLAITTLAITPYFVLLTLIAIFQGCGDLRRPLAIMLVVNGANILGDCLRMIGQYAKAAEILEPARTISSRGRHAKKFFMSALPR